jgi:hypothetical protein
MTGDSLCAQFESSTGELRILRKILILLGRGAGLARPFLLGCRLAQAHQCHLARFPEEDYRHHSVPPLPGCVRWYFRGAARSKRLYRPILPDAGLAIPINPVILGQGSAFSLPGTLGRQSRTRD